MAFDSVRIWRRRDGDSYKYCVDAYGHYAEYDTQVDAARFADRCLHGEEGEEIDELTPKMV